MTTLNIRTDRSLIRASARSDRYIVATVQAPVRERTSKRPPIDVAFVLDRSGSMSGEKIVLARDAVLQGINMLQVNDRFTVVAYDHEIDVVVPLMEATGEARARAEALVLGIHARGNTNLGGGWIRGCELIAGVPGTNRTGSSARGLEVEAEAAAASVRAAGAHAEASADGRTSRCLLLSDGQANQGISNPVELARLAGEMRLRGVLTSTFGVGADFDEYLMAGMAHAGGGHSYFIQDGHQVADLLTSELGEGLETVAWDAALALDLPDDVGIEVLSDFELQSLMGGLARIALGSLVSGQLVQVVARLRFPLGKGGDSMSVRATLQDREDVLDDAAATVAWTWASHEANDEQPRDRVTDIAVATIYAARARREAVELNRAGKFEQAARRLNQTATKIEGYAGDCAQLREIARRLRDEAAEFGAAMDAMAQKSAFYTSMSVLKARSATGKARRTRFEAEAFEARLQVGVPVFTCGGRRVLIHTGSPVSFGRGPLVIAGEVHDLAPGVGPVSIEDISRHLGGVDALVGTDLLGQYQCLLDIHHGRVVFSRGELPLDGRSMRLPSVTGAPVVDVFVAGRPVRAVLDTGASLGYMDPAAIRGRFAGRQRAFHPLVGEFETDVHLVDLELAGLRLQGRFGILPRALAEPLALVGAHWMVGTALLAPFPVLLDLAHGRLKICQEESVLAIS